MFAGKKSCSPKIYNLDVLAAAQEKRNATETPRRCQRDAENELK